MADDKRSSQAPKATSGIERWIAGILIPLVLVALTVADFANDGRISKELIGACLLFAFGFTGRLLDLQVWSNGRRGGGNE